VSQMVEVQQDAPAQPEERGPREGPRDAPARPFTSVFAAVKEPESGGADVCDGGRDTKTEATDDARPTDADAAAWFEKGRRLREKLREARTAALAAESGGEPSGNWEDGEMLCSGCGLWPANSDPVDGGEGGYCGNCWFEWEGALRRPPMPKHRQVLLVRTAKDQGLRLSKLPPLPLKTARPRAGDVTVVLDPSVRYQSFLGFGGAFTESAAKVFQKLSSKKQEQVLNAYFNEDSGLGYRFGRLHMTSCDFSDGEWSCCDKAYDMDLITFSVDRFQEAIFPMVRRAQEAGGKPLKLLASPWSPPAWMKASNEMCKRGDHLLDEFREVWSCYFVRFAEELKAEGLPLWGFTVQNEPENADAAWETCIVTAEEERDFVRSFLGPALEAAGFQDEPRIIVWDHNRGGMVDRARVIYEDPEAAKYVWGMGFHWYADPSYKNVQYVHDMYPDKHLIFTEGCQEGGTFLGDWRLGEIYGANIIEDLNHCTEAWIDWNLVLDENGGPNHKENFCSAPMIADTKRDCVLFQPSYYYIGHFSRHLQPGAERISCTIGGPLEGYEELYATAFFNPDATIALVVLNIGDQSVDFTLCIGGSAAWASAPEHSITTFTLLDGPHPAPVVLGTSGNAPSGPPPERDKYGIVGTWDDWGVVRDMAWDDETQCYHYRVQLTATGWESFQILLHGSWKMALYPGEADGCHHSGSRLCGPDDHGHGRNWTIGRHPLDRAAEGACYQIRLFLQPDGRAERVDWFRLGVTPGSA